MFQQKKICQIKLLQSKNFEYSPLGSELKKETDIEKKKNNIKVFESDKKELDETINKDDKKLTIKNI